MTLGLGQADSIHKMCGTKGRLHKQSHILFAFHYDLVHLLCQESQWIMGNTGEHKQMQEGLVCRPSLVACVADINLITTCMLEECPGSFTPRASICSHFKFGLVQLHSMVGGFLDICSVCLVLCYIVICSMH